MTRRFDTDERWPLRGPPLPRMQLPSLSPPPYPTMNASRPSRQHDLDPGWSSNFDRSRHDNRPRPQNAYPSYTHVDKNLLYRPAPTHMPEVGSSSSSPTMYPPPIYRDARSYLAGPPSPVVDGRRTSAEEWLQRDAALSPPRSRASSGPSPVKRHSSGQLESSLHAVPPHVPVTNQVPDPDPPRARVACSFCRIRKLRCDGASPCRHCERRSIDCVYAPTKSRNKSFTGANGSKASPPSVERGKSSSSVLGQDAEREPETRGLQHPANQSASKRKHHALSDACNGAVKRTKVPDDSSEGHAASTSNEDPESSALLALASTRTRSASDLAMIQNNDTPIPMQPDARQDDWWNHLLSVLGCHRQQSARLIRHLLSCFVASNAIFFGLLHAPTLLDVIASPDGPRRAEPALYLSVLAVAACDMHRSRVSDERTADMRAANETCRELALRLSGLASGFLKTSASKTETLNPAIGQAASILALIQPDGSDEQKSLIHMAEGVVRSLKIYETVSSREPLLQDSEPDSPLYWSRPLASDSPEAEVKYESLVRLCWTGVSHRFRRLIALPDEDLDDNDLPDFVQHVRPMAFWQPSLLPDSLPATFFHSQDLMRRSADLSRIAVSLAKLNRIKPIDVHGRPDKDTIAEVRDKIAALDKLETAFLRHKPQNEAERQSVLGRTLQMFTRMHVWIRLNIWRKYGLWSFPKTSEVDKSASLLHPTLDFWVELFQEMTTSIVEELNGHPVDGAVPQTSVSELDSLIRHVLSALDVIEASGSLRPALAAVDSAINILKRYRSLSSVEPAFPQFEESMIYKLQLAEDRRHHLLSEEMNTVSPNPSLNSTYHSGSVSSHTTLARSPPHSLTQ